MADCLLRCALCGREFNPESHVKTCPDCGIDGTMHVLYDYDEAKKRMGRKELAASFDFSLWRYSALLPVKEGARRPSLHVGWTPIYSVSGIAREYGVREVLVKDDGRNPTASLKDRASCIAVTLALQEGQETVACASTGNAASSLAGFAANVGLRSVIFVPEAAPRRR